MFETLSPDIEEWKRVGNSRYSVSTFGKVINDKTGHIMTKTLTKGGYLTVKLTHDGKSGNKFVHILVAEAFLIKPDKNMSVDHINRDRINNCIGNLRWATPKDQSLNRKKKAPKSMMVRQMNEKGEVMKVWNSASEAAELGGFSKTGIRQSCRTKGKGRHKGYFWTYFEEEIEEEEWRDIEINPHGKIYVSNKGRIKRNKTASFGTKKDDGYMTVQFSKEGNFSNHYVHRLVAKAFIPNPLSLPEIDHIDGNKSNNCVENLRWVTRLENVKAAHETGLQPKRKHPRSKSVVRVDLKTGKEERYDSIVQAARKNNWYVGSISNVCNGRTKISGGYSWKFV